MSLNWHINIYYFILSIISMPILHKKFLQKSLNCLILAVFVSSTICPAQAQSVFSLPTPGTMLGLSQTFDPLLLKAVKVHADNPFQFDFIVDQGQTKFQNEELRQESQKVIRYFLASLTTPENDLWVNLSPYEKDRIIPESFGTTEMGRDLLAQDYILKQLTASLIYPEGEMGKKFWAKVQQQAKDKFGTSEVPTNTLNKVWIVPQKAVVYENGMTAYVSETRLKVMLEEDYLALAESGERGAKRDDVNAIGAQIVREIVLPELEKEVNTGKHFAPLRQIYHSLILANWYKQRLKDSILAQIYIDKNKVSGVDIDDKAESQKIYDRYVEAFKKGVYNYIKEDYDAVSEEVTPRKYFSGGMGFVSSSGVTETRQGLPPAAANIGSGIMQISAEVQTANGETFDDVLQSARRKIRPGHQTIHTAIVEGMSPDFFEFSSLSSDQQRALKDKYRDPESKRIIIPVRGLLRRTGLISHIGLGMYYGEPVVYLDEALSPTSKRNAEDKDKAYLPKFRKVLANSEYEIAQWEAKRRELNLDHSQMRQWIRDHSNTQGTGEAQVLARQWQAQVPPITDIFTDERISFQLQQGRLERALERIYDAADARHTELQSAVSQHVPSLRIETLPREYGFVRNRLSQVAAAVPGKDGGAGYIEMLVSLAEILDDQELGWVAGHEYAHRLISLNNNHPDRSSRAVTPAEVIGHIQGMYSLMVKFESAGSFLRERSPDEQIQFVLSTIPDLKKQLEDASQNEEQAADLLAILLNTWAGLDPQAGVSAFEKIIKAKNLRGYEPEPKGIEYKSHPEDQERLRYMDVYISKQKLAAAVQMYESDVILGAASSSPVTGEVSPMADAVSTEISSPGEQSAGELFERIVAEQKRTIVPWGKRLNWDVPAASSALTPLQTSWLRINQALYLFQGQEGSLDYVRLLKDLVQRGIINKQYARVSIEKGLATPKKYLNREIEYFSEVVKNGFFEKNDPLFDQKLAQIKAEVQRIQNNATDYIHILIDAVEAGLVERTDPRVAQVRESILQDISAYDYAKIMGRLIKADLVRKEEITQDTVAALDGMSLLFLLEADVFEKNDPGLSKAFDFRVSKNRWSRWEVAAYLLAVEKGYVALRDARWERLLMASFDATPGGWGSAFDVRLTRKGDGQLEQWLTLLAAKQDWQNYARLIADAVQEGYVERTEDISARFQRGLRGMLEQEEKVPSIPRNYSQNVIRGVKAGLIKNDGPEMTQMARRTDADSYVTVAIKAGIIDRNDPRINEWLRIFVYKTFEIMTALVETDMIEKGDARVQQTLDYLERMARETFDSHDKDFYLSQYAAFLRTLIEHGFVDLDLSSWRAALDRARQEGLPVGAMVALEGELKGEWSSEEEDGAKDTARNVLARVRTMNAEPDLSAEARINMPVFEHDLVRGIVMLSFINKNLSRQLINNYLDQRGYLPLFRDLLELTAYLDSGYLKVLRKFYQENTGAEFINNPTVLVQLLGYTKSYDSLGFGVEKFRQDLNRPAENPAGVLLGLGKEVMKKLAQVLEIEVNVETANVGGVNPIEKWDLRYLGDLIAGQSAWEESERNYFKLLLRASLEGKEEELVYPPAYSSNYYIFGDENAELVENIRAHNLGLLKTMQNRGLDVNAWLDPNGTIAPVSLFEEGTQRTPAAMLADFKKKVTALYNWMESSGKTEQKTRLENAVGTLTRVTDPTRLLNEDSRRQLARAQRQVIRLQEEFPAGTVPEVVADAVNTFTAVINYNADRPTAKEFLTVDFWEREVGKDIFLGNCAGSCTSLSTNVSAIFGFLLDQGTMYAVVRNEQRDVKGYARFFLSIDRKGKPAIFIDSIDGTAVDHEPAVKAHIAALAEKIGISRENVFDRQSRVIRGKMGGSLLGGYFHHADIDITRSEHPESVLGFKPKGGWKKLSRSASASSAVQRQFSDEFVNDPAFNLTPQEKDFLRENSGVMAVVLAAFSFAEHSLPPLPVLMSETAMKRVQLSPETGEPGPAIMALVNKIIVAMDGNIREHGKKKGAIERTGEYIRQLADLSAVYFYQNYFQRNLTDSEYVDLDFYASVGQLDGRARSLAVLGAGFEGLIAMKHYRGKEVFLVDQNLFFVRLFERLKELNLDRTTQVSGADVTSNNLTKTLTGRFDQVVMNGLLHEVGRTKFGMDFEMNNNLESSIPFSANDASLARQQLMRNAAKLLSPRGILIFTDAAGDEKLNRAQVYANEFAGIPDLVWTISPRVVQLAADQYVIVGQASRASSSVTPQEEPVVATASSAIQNSFSEDFINHPVLSLSEDTKTLMRAAPGEVAAYIAAVSYFAHGTRGKAIVSKSQLQIKMQRFLWSEGDLNVAIEELASKVSMAFFIDPDFAEAYRDQVADNLANYYYRVYHVPITAGLKIDDAVDLERRLSLRDRLTAKSSLAILGAGLQGLPAMTLHPEKRILLVDQNPFIIRLLNSYRILADHRSTTILEQDFTDSQLMWKVPDRFEQVFISRALHEAGRSVPMVNEIMGNREDDVRFQSALAIAARQKFLKNALDLLSQDGFIYIQELFDNDAEPWVARTLNAEIKEYMRRYSDFKVDLGETKTNEAVILYGTIRRTSFLDTNASSAVLTGAAETVGGIDLSKDQLDLEIRGEQIPLKFKFDPAQLQNIQIEGLTPVILNIVPVTNLPLFLTENTPAAEKQLTQVR